MPSCSRLDDDRGLVTHPELQVAFQDASTDTHCFPSPIVQGQVAGIIPWKALVQVGWAAVGI